MKALFFKRRSLKFFASVCILTLTFQIIFPVASYALTSGPSQPEMQSFEPFGTTDMVNLFTGDFNYNIPLLDVGGYPVNIAYHAGASVEQEASWVGLGWNINPGNINHIVRGVSDDFNGEKIEKRLVIEDEVSSTFNLLGSFEFAGVDKSKAKGTAKDVGGTMSKFGGRTQMNFGININNYSGLSASVGLNNQSKIPNIPKISTGINLGATVSTDKGVEINYSLFVSNIPKKMNEEMNYSASVGSGMSSREGMKYTFFGVNASQPINLIGKINTPFEVEMNYTNIPTGLHTYLPVVTNATTVNTNFYQLKIGGEVYMFYPYGGGSFTQSTVKAESDGTKRAFGYFNLDKATDMDIVDFARDKDGRINKKTKYLPTSSLTYDIYAINGQGTGGNFRPHRNDYGTVYDPALGSKANSQSHLVEAGVGNTFEIGYDFKKAYTESSSGPWKINHRKFSGKTGAADATYEPVYLKQAGEISERNEDLFNAIGKTGTLSYSDAQAILGQGAFYNGKRVPRANLLYFLNAKEASLPQVSLLPKLVSYNSIGFNNASDWTNVTLYDRYGTNGAQKEYHASEFVQTQTNGQRYVYGLPIMNKYQYDCEVSIASNINEFNDITSVGWSGGELAPYSSNIVPKFSSKTKTPAYAHSYVLTSVLSPDYVDLTGNGISDDDLGSYTKFNYSKKENYNWRVPYETNTGQVRHGLKSDCKDDRATFSGGSRETWMLHSIESRDFVAEFYTSVRKDGLGATDVNIFGTSNQSYSYKLDSIVLFNKADRKLNENNATRIKTVVFQYDYSLCKGIPNTSLSGQGKLTLKGIYIREGSSKIGYLSPYQFNYSSYNPDYHTAGKDCWGNYKPYESNKILGASPTSNLHLSNLRYPYVNQNDPDLNNYSSAWNLEEIILPSGGSIKVTYEADDYGHVQDKRAMEMFKVAGTGPTTNFVVSNKLYHNAQDPYLYIYFKRRISEEHGASIYETYLKDIDVLQYTFDVNISTGNGNSCSTFPLTEAVKGYAKIVASGVCDNNSDYAYVKIEPKTPNTLTELESIGKQGARLNPITVAAINFARYNNPNALRPESDLPTGSSPADIINSLISSFGEHINFFQNPMKTFTNKSKAKTFELNTSYVRLVSPGLKKKGGGHRVKKIEFFDTWEGTTTLASYGSEYNYTTQDDATGYTISSGVASYEPLFGGDENPWRTLFNTEPSGNNSKFPPVDPIELMQEAPFGESFFPDGGVGYSKVTITSIHKNDGASSQSIQEHQFYTAKDFPVRVLPAGALKVVQDRRPKFYDLKHKREVYQVSQGFTIEFNDMHGKPKSQSTWVAKYDPSNPNAITGAKELVTYTKYNYFENGDGTLNNNQIPCLEFTAGSNEPVVVKKTLGEEVDVTFDSREKVEKSRFSDFHFSANAFLAPPIPITIPVGFPRIKWQSSTFNSLVSTKLIQRYGIIESIETYDKGAIVKAEHTVFDPQTGQPLITTVNTEYGDREHTIKYPAYWAYRNMGMAYENILMEETVGNSVIRDHKVYLNVTDLNKYNIGDELELTLDDVCQGSNGNKFKVWVIDKQKPPVPLVPFNCTATCASISEPIMYRSSKGGCVSFTQLKDILYDKTKDAEVYNLPNTIEKVEIYNKDHDAKYVEINDHQGPLCSRAGYAWAPKLTNDVVIYTAEVYPGYNGSVYPGQSPFYSTLHLLGYREISQMTSKSAPNYQVKFNRTDYEVKIHVASNSNTIPTSSTYSCALYTTGRLFAVNHPNPGWFYPPINSFMLPWCNASVTGQYKLGINSYDVKVTHRDFSLRQPIMLVAVPYKIDAVANNSITSTTPWPEEEEINSATIKVVRSGKRNMLTETVQDITIMDTKDDATNNVPYIGKVSTGLFDKYVKSWYTVINATAKTFTEKAVIPNGIHSDYYNPFVKGEKGNYRVSAVYLPRKKRTDLGGSNPTLASDRYKGMYALNSLWDFQPYGYVDEFVNKVTPNFYADNWELSASYTYSTWGRQIEVVDALFHRNTAVYDFDNKVPVATVANCGLGMALFENFEDAEDLHGYQTSPLKYNHSPIKQWIVDNTSSGTLTGYYADVLLGGDRHSGNNALKFNQVTNINIPISLGMSYFNLVPFYFQTDTKYIVSCWQKVSTNGSAVPTVSNLRVKYGTNVAFLKPKTPPIEGWVLYEGDVTIPASYNGQNASLSAPIGLVIDDLRIFPATANMKAYVYDRIYRRVSATLDENHMTTFFEYNDEGKLIRVKRETEKGIITIKESRESLKKTY